MVLRKPFLRHADGADDFRPQILLAPGPVVKLFRNWIVKKSVDGEIAPLRIRLGVAENDLLRTPAVLVIRLGAKGGDLELLFASTTIITPNLRPMARVRRNSFSICSGRASVAMS